MKLSHLNARSLQPKLCEFRDIVHNSQYDIVGVTETWFVDGMGSDDVSVQGFRLYRSDRLGRGGGVCVYVREYLRCELVDLEVETESPVEYLWLKVHLSGYTIIVGFLYRPPDKKKRPSKLSPFIDDMNKMLSLVSPMGSYLFCLGDVNVDLLTGRGPVVDCFFSFGLDQIISEPTRITSRGGSLVDPIFVSCPSTMIKSSGVVNVDHISDHSLTFVEVKLLREKKVSRLIKYRDFSNFDNDVFLEDLQNKRWIEFLYESNIDNKVEIFNSFLLSVFNKHAPVVTRRVSRPKAPWITDFIRHLMGERDRALNRFKNFRSDDMWKEYKNLRNKVLFEIHLGRAYLENYLTQK
ncbi:uncharacterized protein LOC123315281 [Coccinella septempunctata]|uniref:uncharacterized protein LOC123315278 n=1 Tax=Coccinella septempunctata TaxID=41139 RepID=UPI001D073D3A|nr:uncharacterized protein LOC123315278 [Coccinella septempunctata]XP_044756855.1 uncharacterized protein LOC123315280 [Coccinella septempunctata]XP_044756856.1 uncharacterized protein LOC123315281 [Coccinella septempunctata]